MSYNYSKKIECADEFDVVVCGGVPAGFCAAVQSVRNGCKTALIDKNGCWEAHSHLDVTMKLHCFLRMVNYT